MAQVRFTDNIQRHVRCPDLPIAGASVREVLDAYFQDHPRARGYVLDEHGALRQHMIIFVNGTAVRDRESLADPVAADDTIDVFQALSGG